MHDHHEGDSSDSRLVVAVLVNVLLTIVQVVGGVVSGSLSLVADALHNLSDAGALIVALVARRIARRPPDRLRTFGYRRAEVIGALINLTTLVIVGIYLIYEAVARYFDPQPIDGWIVVWVAGGALVVDTVTAVLTFTLSRNNLNIRAAFVHNVSDALASVAVIVAGSLTILFGWSWADVVATLLISAYVLVQGVSMMRGVVRILMEGVPPDLSIEEVASALASLEGVAGVHHVHVWQFDEEHRAMEAHLVVPGGASDFVPIKQAARTLLEERFRISHTTLELELPSEEGACVRGC
ncbi:Cadmium, cobalt and zinc/H(+)-K(+) antiporter [Planctomycetes bacterium Pla163]|uniref:Cadmium, cobalt and zinc/H(+)-K(+) antiporter n=1 Tax=Rohdeia mirabilis TaxID=2528008 RepID=A0A518CVU5_9BACT|nr:Cadmium, cobalt and zinc/H(+)-K(+) antiporter [Planctomycetes bacterium Pla163]